MFCVSADMKKIKEGRRKKKKNQEEEEPTAEDKEEREKQKVRVQILDGHVCAAQPPPD